MILFFCSRKYISRNQGYKENKTKGNEGILETQCQRLSFDDTTEITKSEASFRIVGHRGLGKAARHRR